MMWVQIGFRILGTEVWIINSVISSKDSLSQKAAVSSSSCLLGYNNVPTHAP